MLAHDLFKKLEPVLGDRIKPLRAVYIAGDEEDNRNVERLLHILYDQIASAIQPPPVCLRSGRFPLGTVINGNLPVGEFSLGNDDWFHLGIFGQTGRGKTNTMLHLLQGLSGKRVPWLVFDWKRAGYRDLLNQAGVAVFTVGRDVSAFRYNPLTPPPGVDKVAWRKQFIQCLSHAYFLGHGCEVILQDVIGDDTPTLLHVMAKLQVYPAKWRKLQWLQSTERAVKALCYGGIRDVLNAENCPPITEWLDRNVVFELDALTESEAKFFVNVVMSAIYFYRRENRHTGLRHVSVIEEAHNVLRKEDKDKEAKSVMDKIFREIREYGEAVAVVDQMPSTLLDSALANMSTQIVFNLTHGRDVSAAGNALLLDEDQRPFLGKLPVGTALVKAQNRWPSSFFVRFPQIPLKRGVVTDETIRERMRSYFGQNAVVPPSLPAAPAITAVSDSDKEAKRLLISIAQEPFVGVVERYRKIELNPRRGNECKKRLLELGWIREVPIAIRNGRLTLFEITDAGNEQLRRLGQFEASMRPVSTRNGGVEHRYWTHLVKRRLRDAGHAVEQEYPIGDGKAVDAAIIGQRRKIAIEIETGKSDARNNIRKCLNAGFDGVISFATNAKAFTQISAALGDLSPNERQAVRVARSWELRLDSSQRTARKGRSANYINRRCDRLVMGNYVTIDFINLETNQDIADRLAEAELYVPFAQDEHGHLYLDDRVVRWDESAYLRDFLKMRDLGVRGSVELYGDNGDWAKYEITDDGVGCFVGLVDYDSTPKYTVTTVRDIEGLP